MEKMRYGVFGFQQTSREKIDKTVVKDCGTVIHEVGEYRSDDFETYQETCREGEHWLDMNVPNWRGMMINGRD